MTAILFYNSDAPDAPSAGGIATYIGHRAAVLSAAGFTVWWGNGSRFGRYEPEAKRWRSVPAPPSGRLQEKAGRFWLPFSALWRFCIREKIAALEMPDGVTAAWPRGGPFRIGLQCHTSQSVRAFFSGVRTPRPLLLPDREKAVAAALARADGLLACSHEVALVTAGFYRVHPDRFTVLPHALAKAPEADLRGGDRHDGLFLSAGNLEHVKGFDLVAEGFRRYRKNGGRAVLAVAGTTGWDDPNPCVTRLLEGAPFRALVAQEGRECVRFLGVLDKASLAEVRSRAAACVVGSRFESFSMAAAEAFLSGCPVLLSDRTGLRGLAERFGAARLVDPYDADDLASAFAELEDPGVRRRLRERGGALADWLAGPELAARTAAWYRGLADGTPPREEAR